MSSSRVFCDRLERSVPIETCVLCPRCDAIEAGPSPRVTCSYLPERSGSDPRGERTKVGTVLRDGTAAVGVMTTSRDALRILRARDRRSLPVVDDDGVLRGVVHETSFVRQPLFAAVTTLMRPATVVPETMPVRSALLVLASTHQREVTVVTRSGRPLGIFRDIDGLRWLACEREACLLDA